MDPERPMVPQRQIRASFDDDTIVVYQAYRPEIAEPALAAGTFVPPFRLERMTWIKPSFLWMMYRCGWATKPGQERVLAIRIRRSGFEWALEHACLSSASKARVSPDELSAYKDRFPVRVQWDPERSLALGRLEHRSIQIGLSGEAVRRYVADWIVDIDDATPLARSIQGLVASGDREQASARLPVERPYPTGGTWAERLRLTVPDRT